MSAAFKRSWNFAHSFIIIHYLHELNSFLMSFNYRNHEIILLCINLISLSCFLQFIYPGTSFIIMSMTEDYIVILIFISVFVEHIKLARMSRLGRSKMYHRHGVSTESYRNYYLKDSEKLFVFWPKKSKSYVLLILMALGYKSEFLQIDV